MTIEAELHDGRVLEFPDGTSPDVVNATVKKMLNPAPAIPAIVDKDPLVGMGEATLATGSGLVGAAAGGLAGLVGSALPGPQGQGASTVQRIIDALRYDPKTSAGKMITNAAAYPFEKIAQGADAAGGAVADAGYPLAGTALNTGIQAIPMALGKVITKVAPKMAPAPNPRPAFAGQAGLSVLPEEAKAGIVTRNLASVADETKLAKDISRKNNPVLADKITKDLGLPKGTELDADTIRTVRKDAYAPYEAVRKLGEISTDAKYAADADAIAGQYRSAARSFPKAAKADVEKIVDSIKVDKFDAGDAVDMTKSLREDANAAFAKGENRMGFANKRAADAIDNMLERHAQKLAVGSDGAGDPAMASVVRDMKNARVTIAKTYAAEKALGPQGTINPQVYARALKKNPDLLTGGSREVAEFARDFPRSSLKPSSTPTGMSPMDVAAAIFTNEGMLPFVRPAARSVMASGPYQSMFVRNPGALMRALGSPTAQGALPAAGASGTRSLDEILRAASER